MDAFTYVNQERDKRHALRVLAEDFVYLHANEYLDRDQLLTRTVDYLRVASTAASASLHDAAINALAKREARGLRAYIDVDCSTSFCVVVRDPEHDRHYALTLKDLLQAATRREDEALPASTQRVAALA